MLCEVVHIQVADVGGIRKDPLHGMPYLREQGQVVNKGNLTFSSDSESCQARNNESTKARQAYPVFLLASADAPRSCFFALSSSLPALIAMTSSSWCL